MSNCALAISTLSSYYESAVPEAVEYHSGYHGDQRYHIEANQYIGLL
jgi:hypothetical protein